MKSKLWNNRGFSLIELLVALSISTIIITGIMNFYTYSIKRYKREDIQWQIHQDARYAVRELTDQIRMSNKIEITREGSSELVQSGSRLTLYMQKLESDINTPLEMVVQIKSSMERSGNKVLRRSVNGGTNTIIKNVDNILFTTDDEPNEISALNITLTVKSPENDIKYTISTTVSKRISVN